MLSTFQGLSSRLLKAPPCPLFGGCIEWVLENNGKVEWPKGTVLQQIAGPKGLTPRDVVVPPAAPGQTVDVVLQLGKITEEACMVYALVPPGNSGMFGEIISIRVAPRPEGLEHQCPNPCCVVISSPRDTKSGNDMALQPGTVDTSEWVLANFGTTPWPSDMCASLMFNTQGLEGLPATISIPPANPGMTVHVTIEARMPEASGQYEAMWQVGSPALQSFSAVLEMNFDVTDKENNLHVIEKRQVWQVDLGQYNGWKDLQEPFVTAVQKAEALGKHIVQVQAFSNHEQKYWHYELDLQRFQQRNLDNGTVRGLRRWPLAPGAKIEAEAEAFDGLSIPLPNGARPEVFKLSTLWLPCLSQERSKTVVIEARSRGSALRVQKSGVDSGGGVGVQSTFIARFTGKLNGNPVVMLQNAKEGMGFLCTSKESRTVLTCKQDLVDVAYHFEVVPGKLSFGAARHLRSVGLPINGSALRVVDTNQYIDVVKGHVVLRNGVPEEKDEQPAELFVVRYQPSYDVSWKEDSQYEGKRRWILNADPEFYSFAQFVSFVKDKGFTFRPHGESGIVAAKMIWATSVPEGITNEELDATKWFARTLKQKRPWSQSNPVLYTFSELLAFIEARGLCTPGKGSIECARAKWLS